VADERLTFDIFANADRAVAGFAAAGRGAKATADEVKKLSDRLDAMKTKSANVKISVDDAAAKAKLDRLNLQLLKIGGRVTADISVEGAAKAAVELSALNAELGHVSRNLNGPGGVRGAAFAAVSALGGFAGMGPALFNPIAIAVAGLAAIMAGPLIAALLPITIGFGLLAAVAVPEIEKVWKAVDKGPKALAKLPPAERAVGTEVAGLKTQFGQLAKAVQPEILDAFGTGLKILKQLMPALRPLLIAAAKAADQFLHSLSDWLASPSGHKFLHWLETEGPKDIATFGRVLWDLAKGAGQVFSFLRNAGNTWWKNFTHVISDISRLVTVVIPAAFDIFKESIRIAFDRVKLLALDAALGIATAFGHLPSFMGAPFRAAAAIIRKEMGGINADVASGVGNIQADFDKLHGKTVTVQFNLSTGVTPPGAPHPAARGWRVPGWGGGDRHPALLEGGETVVPKHLTPAVAPLMAAHGVPGFAAGGYVPGSGFGFRDVFRPSASVFGGQLQSAFNSAENKVIAANKQAMLARLMASFGGGGGGAGGRLTGNVTSWILAAMRLVGGVPGSWLPGLQRLVGFESGGNPLAYNPQPALPSPEHAEGMWQMIPSTFAAYTTGGSIWNPVAEGVAALRYILGRWGSVYNIPGILGGHYGGYDSGGFLPPGLSVAWNGTGRPEQVIPGRRGGGAQKIVLEIRGGHSQFEQFMTTFLKRFVQINGGGSAEAAFAP
jgi:hypothetical protein